MTAETANSVELNAQGRQWLNALRVAKERLEGAQEIVDRCRDQLEAMIGDAEVATVDGEPVIRFTTVTSKRFDQKKFKEQQPDVYEEYCRPQMSRRFTVVDK